MKILFLFPNFATIGGDQPVGVASLAAAMKANGFDFDFYDTSFILQNPQDKNSYTGWKIKQKDRRKKQLLIKEIKQDLLQKFPPKKYDILLVSALSSTYKPALKLIRAIKSKHPGIFVVMGGTHPTVAPELTIKEKEIDAICLGEGEEALIELLSSLKEDKPISNIRNFWFRKSGKKIIKNPLRPYVNLDNLPYPDYSILKKEHFYRPFVNDIPRMLAVEISRGCPYRCRFCVNEYLQNLYAGISRHHRRHTVDSAIKKLISLKETYRPEFIRFIDESFSFMPLPYFKEFSAEYKKNINLPFWMQTAAPALSEQKVKLLKEMNCVAVTIGIEHGDENFRKRILNKNVSNKDIINAVKLLKKYDLRRAAYFMIGLPHETRENIFATIKFYRKLVNNYGLAPSGARCFYPFEGTELLKECEKHNFIKPEANTNNAIYEPALDMPQLSFKEILGLKRTFFAYSVVEEKCFPVIEVCEEINETTDKILNTISRIYSR